MPSPNRRSRSRSRSRSKSPKRSLAKKARKTPKKPRAKGRAKKPSTLSIIVAVIQAMKNTKGSSIQAIRKYILANNKRINTSYLGSAMKLAFANGLKCGVLVRTKTSAGASCASGATGSFRVGKALASPKKKAKKTKSPKKKSNNASNNDKAKKSPRKTKAVIKKSSKSKAKKPKSPKKKKAAKKPAKLCPFPLSKRIYTFCI
ncbi:sperm-specific protein PHI-2B-like [Mytilus californianus]|uniref:sperm-specific protein PHI-2B-like n=1 Tax=Mytilus californianus TaxID=6549 RepID=UPI002246A8D7|nr:sperm-specific protein PHI-2B-like [Mytilus californianus]